MLSERKRFNYNVGNTTTLRSQSKNKPTVTAIVAPVSHLPKDENLSSSKLTYPRENNKRIEELQAINKKLIEETTSQFKRLESDVQRVEKILEEKEGNISDLEKEKAHLHAELENTTEEKKLLIQAIFQKDLIIKEYESKLKELLEYREKEVTSEPSPVQTNDCEAQTEDVEQPDVVPKIDFYHLEDANNELQSELYETKQQLFDAKNKVKLITQQFQAYKLLKQIQSIEEI